MRGVGDELPLRPARALERGEHRVEARREPAELVVAGRGRLDPLREVTRLGDGLRGLGQPSHRRERGARDDQTERGGDADPADRDQDQEERDPVQRAVHLAERPCDLDGIRRGRDGQDPKLDPLEVAVAVVERLLAARGLVVLLGHRQLVGRVGLHVGPTGKRNGLDEVALHADVRPRDVELAVVDLRLRATRDLDRPGVQRPVDLTEELVVHDHEHDDRGDDHRDADRRGGHEREPGAKAHASRSA